jgi:hypothetical protein
MDFESSGFTTQATYSQQWSREAATKAIVKNQCTDRPGQKSPFVKTNTGYGTDKTGKSVKYTSTSLSCDVGMSLCWKLFGHSETKYNPMRYFRCFGGTCALKESVGPKMESAISFGCQPSLA